MRKGEGFVGKWNVLGEKMEWVVTIGTNSGGLIGLGERLGAWVNVGVWKGEDGEDGVGNGPGEG